MLRQIMQFGVVGGVAMLVHWVTVLILVPWGTVPLLANIVGFVVAFNVSYHGHRQWTFTAHALSHAQTLPRFFAVAIGSFLINEGLYYQLLSHTQLDYRMALAMVLLTVAILTFIFSRYWAFNKS